MGRDTPQKRPGACGPKYQNPVASRLLSGGLAQLPVLRGRFRVPTPSANLATCSLVSSLASLATRSSECRHLRRALLLIVKRVLAPSLAVYLPRTLLYYVERRGGREQGTCDWQSEGAAVPTNIEFLLATSQFMQLSLPTHLLRFAPS